MTGRITFIVLLLLPNLLWAQQSGDEAAVIENPVDGLYRFDYQVSDYIGSFLTFDGKEVSVFLENELIKTSDSDTIYLDRLGSREIQLAFTSSYPVDFKIVRPKKAVATGLAPTDRQYRGYYNFVSIFLSFFLVLLAVVKWNQGKDLVEYFRLSRMISPRNYDENIFRNKLFSYQNLQHFLVFAFLLSGLMVCVRELAGQEFSGLGSYVISWIWYLVLCSLFLIVKLILVSLFCYIYNFQSFVQIHLINYLRISAVLAAIWTVIIITISWFDITSTNLDPIRIGIIISVVFTMAIIFLKLINAEGYRRFHLFSYLCATEIIPFFGLVYFTSGFFK